MLRRHSIAVLAVATLGFFATAPAHAGGTGGAVGVKKTANVKIQNVGTIPSSVVIVPHGLAPPVTVRDAKRLGAILLGASSRQIFYPVPSGGGRSP